MSHTTGPLIVSISDKWPFDIVTTNANGDIVFTTRMPCHSSADKTKEDAIECKHFKHAEREKYSAVNKLAISDDVLRAAAPDLFDALQALIDMDVSYQRGPKVEQAVDNARAAISKATGAAS